MKYKLGSLFIGLLLSFSHAEITDPKEQYKRGQDYYFGKNGLQIDYEKAHNWYEKAAQQNNYYAQSSLSNLYLSGLLGDIDYEQGLYWMQQACNNGYETSCRNIARTTKKFEQKKNREKLEKTSEGNDPKALFELGNMYYTSGNGVPQDQKQAIHYWEKSADLNYIPAQFKLGEHYQHNSQYSEAKHWFDKAAESNHSYAQFYLGLQNERGNLAPRDIPLALYWYEKSAEQNNEKALYNLGIIYANGEINGIKDLQKAFDLWQKAAHNGSYLAEQRLAQLYHTGQLASIPQDYIEAAILYEKGYALSNGSGSPEHMKLLAQTASNFQELQEKAKEGDTTAQYLMGAEYYTGMGVDRNIPLAIEWFTLSAEKKHLKSQLKLGQIYESNREYTKAIDWYEKAATQHNSDLAQYALGDIYESDRGNPEAFDIEKAKYWYKEAIKNGHGGAPYRLKAINQP